jgi:hypothetical protein
MRRQAGERSDLRDSGAMARSLVAQIKRNMASQLSGFIAEEVARQLGARRKPKRKRQRIADTSAASLTTPARAYPRTSLLGLPAELRLMIYDYLWETALIHVHRRTRSGGLIPPVFSNDYQWFHDKKLTWTPCKAVDSQSHCLCAHPVWDGTVEEAQRCSDLPSAPNRPTGIFALRWTCKGLREELGDSHRHKAAVSLECDSSSVSTFTEITPPSILNTLTRLTLVGERFNPVLRRDMSDELFRVAIVYGPDSLYKKMATSLPHLEAVAIRGFVSAALARAILASIRGERVSRIIQRPLDCIANIFDAFSRKTTVVLDVSSRPNGRLEQHGLAEINRFIVTRRATNPSDAPKGHDWATCELKTMGLAWEALQVPGRALIERGA